MPIPIPLPALEAILKENPSIEVVIDLHRDEVAEGTRLVTEIGGKKNGALHVFQRTVQNETARGH